MAKRQLSWDWRRDASEAAGPQQPRTPEARRPTVPAKLLALVYNSQVCVERPTPVPKQTFR